MKVQLDQVLFLNLLFRIFLLIYFVKEEPEKSVKAKVLKHWLDPLSKRVVLIFINGLERNFLKQNSTPFLSEMLDKHGTFGVALTGYMQTSQQGMRTVLTGKKNPFVFFRWMRKNCGDSILDTEAFSCGMGNLPMDLSWKCHYPEQYPLKNFHKFPGLFDLKKRRSSLYIMSFDLDPVLVRDYRSRLRKIDDDIRFFATMVDNFYGANRTTYIVTSARGSPVGESLSTDVPVVVWGKGISHVPNEVIYLKQSDLTAMLSALLGVNFPSAMFGVIPMAMLDLEDYYEFELTLYTIRHFEKVLQLVDVKDHLYDSAELELDQVNTRMENIILKLRRAQIIEWSLTSFWVIVLLMVWGVHLTAYASSEFACFFWHLKSLFLLLVIVGTTLAYRRLGLELLVALELLLFSVWQNRSLIYEATIKNAVINMELSVVTFTVVAVVSAIGQQIALPLMLIPVILWPLFNGSFLRLNRFVLFTRLLSGITLGALPLNRTYGELPDRTTLVFISFLFLTNFYFFIALFNRKFDTYMKINFFMILATTAHAYYIRQFQLLWLRDALSYFFLTFSFLSVCFVSGTLLEKFFKIHLSLFISVLMLTVRLESIFYLSIFFNVFSWIFTDYHSKNPAQYQFCSAIFSIEPKNTLKQIRFSDEDICLIAFFLIYSYVSYFAIGHHPDLHSYDLYVVPTFVYKHPQMVNYFLGGLKFFLPFFVVTTSFVTLCLVKEKNFAPLIMMSVWISDLVGCFLIFFSQFINRMVVRNLFSAKFSYFFVQQCGTASIILSYFIGKHLLLGSEGLVKKFFSKRNTEYQANKN